MTILRFTPANSYEFAKSCTALQMSLGCIIQPQSDGAILIVAFADADADLIRDTLTDFGGQLIETLTIDEYMKEAK